MHHKDWARISLCLWCSTCHNVIHFVWWQMNQQQPQQQQQHQPFNETWIGSGTKPAGSKDKAWRTYALLTSKKYRCHKRVLLIHSSEKKRKRRKRRRRRRRTRSDQRKRERREKKCCTCLGQWGVLDRGPVWRKADFRSNNKVSPCDWWHFYGTTGPLATLHSPLNKHSTGTEKWMQGPGQSDHMILHPRRMEKRGRESERGRKAVPVTSGIQVSIGTLFTSQECICNATLQPVSQPVNVDSFGCDWVDL